MGSGESKLREKEARVTFETPVVCSEHIRIVRSDDSKMREKEVRVTYIGGTECE